MSIRHHHTLMSKKTLLLIIAAIIVVLAILSVIRGSLVLRPISNPSQSPVVVKSPPANLASTSATIWQSAANGGFNTGYCVLQNGSCVGKDRQGNSVSLSYV